MKFKSILISLVVIFLILSANDSQIHAESKSSPKNRFIDNKDGTISDSKTGLMWIKNDSFLHSGHWINWSEAKAYINDLNKTGYANYFDWKLPTTRELKTLYDAKKVNSSQVGREMKIHVDPLFGKNGSGSLWSMNENGRHNAFGVVFNTGDVFSANKYSRSRKATRGVRVFLHNN
ncbi:MAG: DUF1566 domain-containing protein [Nitrospinota bacterium]|nr:DUF1566 domain-containing protein [Nitrospinota bacterium]